MTHFTKTKKPHLIYGAVLVIIVGVFSLLLYKSDKPGSLKLQLGDSQLEINLEGDSLSIKSMLDHLFKDETTKRESGALLKEFGSFYQPSDPSLVTVLEQQDVQSEVAIRLRSLLYNLKGPFERSAHTFYDVQDVHIVDAIERLGFDHAVSKELRELLVYRKGPFEEQAKEILLSVPQGNGIPEGRAASCTGSEFYRREIRIFNLQRTNSISAYVSGSFPCPEADTEGQDEIGKLVQISNLDMKKLIGDSTLIAKEPGFAEILIDSQ
jgi:hypothetical protein